LQQLTKDSIPKFITQHRKALIELSLLMTVQIMSEEVVSFSSSSSFQFHVNRNKPAVCHRGTNQIHCGEEEKEGKVGPPETYLLGKHEKGSQAGGVGNGTPPSHLQAVVCLSVCLSVAQKTLSLSSAIWGRIAKLPPSPEMFRRITLLPSSDIFQTTKLLPTSKMFRRNGLTPSSETF
jgi:hypothetical protein